MPDEYLGQNITDVDTGEGETPRSFCWRGETHQVAETLLVSHVYGVGQAREGRLWMPRARATYYTVRTSGGAILELVRERLKDGECWSISRSLQAPPAAETPEQPRGVVGVGRPKPQLPPLYRVLDYQDNMSPWMTLLLESGGEQPSHLLRGSAPLARHVAAYERLMVGMVEVGEPLLGGPEGRAEVRCLCVLPAFRRMGIGLGLLKRAEASARGAGFKSLQAAVPVTDESGAGLALMRSNRMEFERCVLVVKRGEQVTPVSPAAYWESFPGSEHSIVVAFAVYFKEL